MEGGAALIELVFAFAVVMGFAVYQLVRVRREIRRDRERASGSEGANSPPGP